MTFVRAREVETSCFLSSTEKARSTSEKLDELHLLLASGSPRWLLCPVTHYLSGFHQCQLTFCLASAVEPGFLPSLPGLTYSPVPHPAFCQPLSPVVPALAILSPLEA